MTRRGVRGRGRPFANQAKEEAESGNKVSKKLLLNALQSGTLNLQNREMTVIPDDVYNLNDAELLQTLVGEDNEGLKWWETEPITKLYLCSNKIRVITPAIAGISSLVLLDVRDNQIESLPEEMSQLAALVRLELSHNKLSSLPSAFGPNLTHLSLNNNNLETFPTAVKNLHQLQSLDLRENKISSFGEVPDSLQNLALDDNKISALRLENHESLLAITATNNSLTSVRVGNLPRLRVLSVRGNKLEVIEPILECPELSEVLVGKNFLSSIDFILSNTEVLTVLDCSDNKINTLPDNVTAMTRLKRLDLTNNDLSSLPPQLALLENLNSLAIEGNSLRAIRREIIAKGTVAIKDYLRMKLPQSEELEQGPTIPNIAPDEMMLQSKTLELDKQSNVPPETWDQALVCSITRLTMRQCALSTLPAQIILLRASLLELELSSNNLQEITPEIGKLRKLRKLNLLNNNLQSLPAELGELVALEDLNVGQNKLVEIPECIYDLQACCNLILSNNQLAKVEPEKLQTMSSLVCLDLENNNIGRLHPELSLIPKLRTLLVMGNTFKFPRADVLSKGSAEVISWLKNKVPQPIKL